MFPFLVVYFLSLFVSPCSGAWIVMYCSCLINHGVFCVVRRWERGYCMVATSMCLVATPLTWGGSEVRVVVWGRGNYTQPLRLSHTVSVTCNVENTNYCWWMNVVIVPLYVHHWRTGVIML